MGRNLILPDFHEKAVDRIHQFTWFIWNHAIRRIDHAKKRDIDTIDVQKTAPGIAHNACVLGLSFYLSDFCAFISSK